MGETQLKTPSTLRVEPARSGHRQLAGRRLLRRPRWPRPRAGSLLFGGDGLHRTFPSGLMRWTDVDQTLPCLVRTKANPFQGLRFATWLNGACIRHLVSESVALGVVVRSCAVARSFITKYQGTAPPLHMLVWKRDKSIPLHFLYPESFASKILSSVRSRAGNGGSAAVGLRRMNNKKGTAKVSWGAFRALQRDGWQSAQQMSN